MASTHRLRASPSAVYCEITDLSPPSVIAAGGTRGIAMRALGITAIVLCGVGQGSCATPLATSEDTEGPMRTEIACLTTAAKALDDLTSDAVTIAYGVMGRCDREIRQSIAAGSKGLTFEGQQTFRTRMNQEILKSTTAIVLELRRGATQKPRQHDRLRRDRALIPINTIPGGERLRRQGRAPCVPRVSGYRHNGRQFRRLTGLPAWQLCRTRLDSPSVRNGRTLVRNQSRDA